MKIKYDRIFVVLIALCLAISGCTDSQMAAPTSTATRAPSVTPRPTATPTATPIPFPEISLKPGDFYFNVDGQTRLGSQLLLDRAIQVCYIIFVLITNL
jgi:hypothetical protein